MARSFRSPLTPQGHLRSCPTSESLGACPRRDNECGGVELGREPSRIRKGTPGRLWSLSRGSGRGALAGGRSSLSQLLQFHRSRNEITYSAVSCSSQIAPWEEYQLTRLHPHRLSSLSLLAPSVPPSVFRPSPQTPFPATTPPTDLCTLSSLLLVSLPGFHASDLLLLPSTSAILTSLNAASDRSLTLPYLPLRQNQRASSGGPEKLAKTFVAECGAVIQQEGTANFWGGEAGKTLMVEVVDGLDEWELVGASARNERASIMQRVGPSSLSPPSPSCGTHSEDPQTLSSLDTSRPFRRPTSSSSPPSQDHRPLPSTRTPSASSRTRESTRSRTRRTR